MTNGIVAAIEERNLLRQELAEAFAEISALEVLNERQTEMIVRLRGRDNLLSDGSLPRPGIIILWQRIQELETQVDELQSVLSLQSRKEEQNGQ